MSVLIEAVSVVIRREAISQKYPGGWPAFVLETPAPSLCADNVLVALSFWEPADADSCIEFLVRKGLVHLHNGYPVDIEIVDQTQGCKHLAHWCEMIECYIDGDPSKSVAACKAHVLGEDRLFVPQGWTYEGSLSECCIYIETANRDQCVTFQCHEDCRDIYNSPLLEPGEVFYVKRSY